MILKHEKGSKYGTL